MQMIVARDGYRIETVVVAKPKGNVWVSTISKDGVLLGKKVYRTPALALAGHAKLAQFYLEETA